MARYGRRLLVKIAIQRSSLTGSPEVERILDREWEAMSDETPDTDSDDPDASSAEHALSGMVGAGALTSCAGGPPVLAASEVARACASGASDVCALRLFARPEATG